MAYSALPIPSVPNLRSIDTDTYIYISPPNNGLGKTGSAGTWTGFTWGNDSTGDGTLAKPYATLRKAWETAQEYIVAGNATLYIQFQKGIYGYTYDANTTSTNPFPDNLFHPQGDRIVIQGDPVALKQRYLYRVSNYSWDLSRWTHYGHTGTVNLWRGQHAQGDTAASYPTGSGNTAHGFTAEDNLGYVAISNAAMGVPFNMVYFDPYNGVHNGNKYNFPHNWGRAHFNHGLSYEEATGIVGLARIENASSSAFDLNLQFKNINLDGRVNTFPMSSAVVNGKIPSGLANGLSYGGIDSNYPEPQYSVPNGFYGPTFGVNASGANVTVAWNTDNVVSYGLNPSLSVNMTYPSRNGGEVHVTDDPHILSNYPVVIKVYSANAASTNCRPVPFVLDGCRVRSIRNLMLVNGDIEGQSYTKLNTGATLAPANGLQGLRLIDGDGERTWARQCMTLRRGAYAAVRHLGMLGWGNGIGSSSSVAVTNGSQLVTDPCIDAEEYMISKYGSGVLNAGAVAELGRLHNTPVLMISHGGGIAVSDGGSVRLCHVDNTGYAQLPKNNHYTDQSSWVQSCWSGGLVVTGVGSKALLGSATLINASAIPATYRIDLSLPVLAGMTVFGGSTGMFMASEVFGNAAGKGVTYNSIVGFKNTTAGRTPFCRITKITGGGTYGTGTRTATTWSGGLSPEYNQIVTLRGVKIHSPGMDQSEAVRGFLDSAAGNTLEFFAYHDGSDGITVANQYFGVSRTGVAIRVPGGVTYTGTTNTANFGFTYAFAGMTSQQGREDPISLYDYNNDGYQNIILTDLAQVEALGNVRLAGKCYIQMHAINQSDYLQTYGNLLVQDYVHSGVLIETGSSFRFLHGQGLLVTKHPVGYGIGFGADPFSNYGYGLYARHSGTISVYARVAQVTIPFSASATTNEFSQYVGFFGNTGTSSPGLQSRLNVDVPPQMPIICENNSSLNLASSYTLPHVLSWDGGSGNEATSTASRLAAFASGSSISGIGSLFHVWNPSQGQGTIRVGTMTRAPYGSATTSTINQWLYNGPRGSTMWFSTSSGQTGFISTASPSSATNNYAFLDLIQYSGAALARTFTDPQRAAVYTANPPGYSGPGVGVSNTMTVNVYLGG